MVTHKQFPNHKVYEMEIGGRPFTVETGKVAELADAECICRYGDTVVLTTVTCNPIPKAGIDYFPLTIEFEERMYAVGRIPGSFNRREGKPSERGILNSRIIDRPMRPLFDEELRNDTVVTCTVLANDYENPVEIVASLGASIAIASSDVPWNGPVATTNVAYLDGERPYLIVCRGYYTRATLVAYDFFDNKFRETWSVDSGFVPMDNPFCADACHGETGTDPVFGTLAGQGNHSIATADVDGDGCMEIIYGAAVIDHDGSLLYSSYGNLPDGRRAKFGHGDAMHVADIDPDSPGLEIFNVYEGAENAPYGWALRDAETGESIAQTAARHQVYFQPGDHKRLPGWMQVHYRLSMDENGCPMLYVFKNCRAFIRTMPLLQYDGTNCEDVDTDGEDHVADEVRYFCMSRPIRPRVRPAGDGYDNSPMKLFLDIPREQITAAQRRP